MTPCLLLESGERTAQVVELIPDNVNGPMIWLDNRGYINPTDLIKQIKICSRGELHDNPEPRWWEFQDFVLIAQKLDPNAKKPRKSRFGQQVGQLMKCLSGQISTIGSRARYASRSTLLPMQ